MDNLNTLMTLLKMYEIRIPIIQRDYAQGRNTEKANEVRKNLIGDFKKCLSENGENIDFNFVYGTVSNDVFYPVDGQQRLTSLYLLHWYLNCNLAADKMSELRNFSYMTRNSASDFFSILKSPSTELKEIAKSYTSFRQAVEEKSWFQVEWKYDPTVSAALNFLDDLSKDACFKNNAAAYFNRLENGAITFSFIQEQPNNAEINAAKRYIRMNARGKSLEPFENLKAMIDSIDSKFDKQTNIILNYDQSYINALYSSQNEAHSLNQKTKNINAMSISCLKNIYNLCAQLDKAKECKAKEHTFISEIYEDSQNSGLSKDFYKTYFNCVKAVFEYYCKNTNNDYIKDIWSDKGTFTASENRECVAAILYIYHHSTKNEKEPVTKDNIEKYIYVLENLKYTGWDTFIDNINSLSEQVAKSDDIFVYFSDDTSSADLNITNCGLEDIKVRIKEQKIKAKIISVNSLGWNYFKDLEGKFSERKIQCLLYISGYWDDYAKGDFGNLKKYTEIANTYYYNNIDWLKIYAVTTNMDEDSNTLKDTAEINRNAGDTHIWNNDFYYWYDSDDENISNNTQINNIKTAYVKLDNIKQIITNLPNDNKYNKCWLKYAVKYAADDRSSVLLKNRLSSIDANVFVEEKISSWNNNTINTRYDIYILQIVKSATKGLGNFNVFAQAEYRFEANKTYTNNNEEYMQTGDRAFIMRLKSFITISGVNENHNSPNSLHCFYGNNNYEVYEFDENLYEYTEYQYNLSDVIKARDDAKITEQNNLSGFEGNNYISIYQQNKDCKYKRDGASSYYMGSTKNVKNNSQPTRSSMSL